MAITQEDLKVLSDIQMHASLYADLCVDLIKKEKIESFALSLGSVHNALRRAARDAQNIIDRVNYLEQTHGADA